MWKKRYDLCVVSMGNRLPAFYLSPDLRSVGTLQGVLWALAQFHLHGPSFACMCPFCTYSLWTWLCLVSAHLGVTTTMPGMLSFAAQHHRCDEGIVDMVNAQKVCAE